MTMEILFWVQQQGQKYWHALFVINVFLHICPDFFFILMRVNLHVYLFLLTTGLCLNFNKLAYLLPTHPHLQFQTLIICLWDALST